MSASILLYYRGCVVLNDFMISIGKQAFMKLLKEAHSKKVRATAELNQVIQNTISSEAAQKLEQLLKE